MRELPRPIGGAELAALGAELANVTAAADLVVFAETYNRPLALVWWLWLAARVVEIPAPRSRPYVPQLGTDTPLPRQRRGRHRAARKVVDYEIPLTP